MKGQAIRRLLDAKERHLRVSMFVPLPRDEVFNFFADAANLERITPKALGFSILTPFPIEMREGTEIRYRLKLFGFPVSWRTLIPVWRPPFEFVDEQLEGPYAQWIHRHTFDPVEEGTLVADHVRYRLPFGLLGDLAHPLVRLQLKQIFSYRQRAIRECLLR